MAKGFVLQVVAEGLDTFKRYLKDFPDRAKTAMRIALNDVASGEGLKLLRSEIEDEINYPKGYLNKNDRLFLRRKAHNDRLEAVITGRDRPTSLARFAVAGKQGLAVQVKQHGGRTVMKRAFFVRLKAGATLSNDSFNMGLALRVSPGQTVQGKYRHGSQLIFPNVYLLYGPSVGQVLPDTASDNSEAIGDMVVDEFYRQFDRSGRE